jgi:2-dehydropantoate 2-reductase
VDLNIAIQGLGAMGSLYVAAFTDAGFNVSVIADGPRANRIEDEGFTLNGKHYPVKVARPSSEQTPVDLIIVGLKQHHLAGAIEDLAPFVGDQTQILSLINGLDSEPMLIERFGEEHVLYCSTIKMTPVRDGNVVQSDDMGFLVFGESHNEDPPSERVQRVQTMCDAAGIQYKTAPDMLREVWWKFMVNVGVNQVSGVLRTPYGRMKQDPDVLVLMVGLMREVLALAAAEGINLNEQDIDDFKRIFQTLTDDGKTSMLQDVEAGRPNEVDIFAGKVVELGQKHGIPTPLNQSFLHMLRVLMPS